MGNEKAVGGFGFWCGICVRNCFEIFEDGSFYLDGFRESRIVVHLMVSDFLFRMYELSVKCIFIDAI